MEKFVVLEKAVGETPLSCAEAYRATRPELAGVPLAYAGRLDPMASGKLLVLLGEECKHQENYHSLDKEYEFSVLLGIGSDTHDVLGRLTTCPTGTIANQATIASIGASLMGNIALPYPHFSSRTVQGKPLHMWTLEGRLHEIEIPTQESTIYELALHKLETKPRAQVVDEARTKIDTIPPVTELRKALGNDFRRVDVRLDWEKIKNDHSLPSEYTIAHFRCLASSGTYMRSLALLIGQRLGTCGLAWHIHRTHIGTYNPTTKSWHHEY
jgi:tRNA pseudouridine(55) synthase